jgi:hypothetical protein
MNKFVVIFIATQLIAVSLATSCTGSGWNDNCFAADAALPYCGSKNNATLSCVACISDCDCPTGKYCSQNYFDEIAGTCVDFKALGKSCLDLPVSALSNPSVSTDKKCADVSSKSIGGKVFADRPDTAVCIAGLCQFCNGFERESVPGNSVYFADSNTKKIYCAERGTHNSQDVRVCTLSGYMVPLWQVQWRLFEYSMSPTWAWLAVFFPLILFISLCSCCTCCYTYKDFTAKIVRRAKRGRNARRDVDIE